MREPVPYRTKGQLNAFVTAAVPTEEDKAKPTSWLDYLNRKNSGGNPVSPDNFEFAVLKDGYPCNE